MNYQENIVPAIGQNDTNVFLHKRQGSKIRLLIVGNSISKHAPKPSIGWNRDCGMAASSEDRDFVHLLVAKIEEKYDKNVSWGIAQAAQYARTFTENGPECDYSLARDFGANVILMFFGANVPHEYDSASEHKKTFGEAYRDMRNYLSSDSGASVFHSMGFYKRPVLEAEKRTVAEQYGDVYIDITDIQDAPEAHGLFNHPSDIGMQMLADRFFDALDSTLAKLI